MTTVIAYKNKLVADRRVGFVPIAGEAYMGSVPTKIHMSNCGRVAVVIQPYLPGDSLLKAAVENITMAVIEKELNNLDHLVLRTGLYKEILFEENIDIIAVTRKGMYVSRLKTEKLKAEGNLDSKEMGVNVFTLDKDSLFTSGAGGDYVIGMHLAKPKMPITKLLTEASKLSPMTSKEYDVIKCSDLNPIKEIKLGGK